VGNTFAGIAARRLLVLEEVRNIFIFSGGGEEQARKPLLPASRCAKTNANQ